MTDYDFKIYFLCVLNYLYNFLFTLKTAKIDFLKWIKSLSDSSSVVFQLCQTLSKLYNYMIYINNFFINIKLFMTLKELKIEVCKTAKNESKFSLELLAL